MLAISSCWARGSGLFWSSWMGLASANYIFRPFSCHFQREGSKLMSGYLVLEGGAEFGGRMAEPDRRALELAGGLAVPVRILPTAAAPDQNDLRAGANGVRWFRSLGASDVAAVPVLDAASANDPALAGGLREVRLIYLLGGFPGYLAPTLAGSLCWQAMLEAFAGGA